MADQYEAGYRQGYEAYNGGSESEFYCSRNAPIVLRRRVNADPETVRPEGLDYARGYIDGFMRAESDSHD